LGSWCRPLQRATTAHAAPQGANLDPLRIAPLTGRSERLLSGAVAILDRVHSPLNAERAAVPGDSLETFDAMQARRGLCRE